ncbi:hypothetical protein DMUE_0798 [Dictyocoela muelleri]|nr:hypothetical protein DMUE_0798 [Dictyocoela muelleri]
MVNIIFLLSNKQKAMLVVDNFVFRINKTVADNRRYWKCSSEHCVVRATTVVQDLVEVKGVHTHFNEIEKVIKYQIRDLLKSNIISNPYRSSQDIYDQAKQILEASYKTTISIAHLLPSFDSVKSNISRWKSMEAPTGRILDRNSFDLDFFKIDENRDLLLHVEFEGDLMVVLGDSTYINRFSEARNFKIVIDGTFKSYSSSFFQIYIIMDFSQNKVSH